MPDDLGELALARCDQACHGQCGLNLARCGLVAAKCLRLAGFEVGEPLARSRLLGSERLQRALRLGNGLVPDAQELSQGKPAGGSGLAAGRRGLGRRRSWGRGTEGNRIRVCQSAQPQPRQQRYPPSQQHRLSRQRWLPSWKPCQLNQHLQECHPAPCTRQGWGKVRKSALREGEGDNRRPSQAQDSRHSGCGWGSRGEPRHRKHGRHGHPERQAEGA